MVTMEEWCTNQQVTNVESFNFMEQYHTKNEYGLLVGTPEAVCPPTNFGNKKQTKTNKKARKSQWLAGLIDGDGHFGVSKEKYTSLEITVHAKDELVVKKVKHLYGGSVKPRSGNNSVRYRLNNKKRIIDLCNDINGYIRHPVRLKQFEKVCNRQELNLKNVDLLHDKHGWFRGMFDRDGTVTQNCSGLAKGQSCCLDFGQAAGNGIYPQITISVTQKDKSVPLAFREVFGGSLFFDKSQNGYWTWSVQSKQNVQQMLEYFKHFPVQSSRRQKFFLIPRQYECINQKPIKDKNSAMYKKYTNLIEKWRSY